MEVFDFLLSNGRTTEIRGINFLPDFLVNSAVCAVASSTENSLNNARNVNFSDGNTNANNKYNGNAVRAVAALSEEIKLSWVEAFHNCCKKKKQSSNCNAYRADNWERDLWLLVHQVYTREYQPKPSVCFIVTRPTLREIFAADFRDRIVQHWICLRLEPLFEQRFTQQGNVSHNCRKGFGTLSAVRALQRDIEQVSQNYTRQAWVTKLDVRSFFMTIDTEVLWQQLKQFIEQYYKGDDIDTLLYLTEVTIKHRPQQDAIKRSNPELWQQLPPHKSLFTHPNRTGIAIGNITSQLAANFYMSSYIEQVLPFVKSSGAKVEQFVDDIAFVGATKAECLQFRDISRRILSDTLHLQLHPDKFYLQQVTKGVKFVGQVIKPHRRYISNRTAAGLTDALRAAERIAAAILNGQHNAPTLYALRHAVDSVNSYLGLMAHTNSYNVRRKLFSRECVALQRVCVCRNFAVCYIRSKYNITRYLLTKEFNDYGIDYYRHRAAFGRHNRQTRTKATRSKLQHIENRGRSAMAA